jgi:hypothetical protein
MLLLCPGDNFSMGFTGPACPCARLQMAPQIFAYEKFINAICKRSKRHRKPASVQGRQFLYDLDSKISKLVLI